MLDLQAKAAVCACTLRVLATESAGLGAVADKQSDSIARLRLAMDLEQVDRTLRIGAGTHSRKQQREAPSQPPVPANKAEAGMRPSEVVKPHGSS